MISKIVAFSFLVAFVSAKCTWDETLCDKIPNHDAIDAELKSYTDKLERTGEDAFTLYEVLEIDLRCMRNACDGDDIAADLEDCRQKAKMLVENQLQFVPSNFVQQLDKMCECDYAAVDKEEVGGASIHSDHLKSLYNCNQVKKTDQVWCHNAPAIAHSLGFCDVDGHMTMSDMTREAMESTRIRKFCDRADVKAFVEGDDIAKVDAPGGCLEEKELKKSLVTMCSDGCYYNPEHLHVMRQPAFFTDDYTFNQTAQYSGCEFGARSVRAVSGKTAANKMCEICWEYLVNPDEVPLQLQFPLYAASVVTDDEIKAALKDACKLPVEDYKIIDHLDTTSDVGTKELKVLSSKGLATEYGFMADMRRKVVTKRTENCFNIKNVEYSHCNSSNPSYARPSFDDNCQDGMEMMDVCEGATLKSFNWFLKYPLSNETAVLEACEAGALFGKHILTLPGLSTTYAAVNHAMAVKKGTKTEAFLVFQDCAVAAAIRANNYFQPGLDSCNQNAMNFHVE